LETKTSLLLQGRPLVVLVTPRHLEDAFQFTVMCGGRSRWSRPIPIHLMFFRILNVDDKMDHALVQCLNWVGTHWHGVPTDSDLCPPCVPCTDYCVLPLIRESRYADSSYFQIRTSHFAQMYRYIRNRSRWKIVRRSVMYFTPAVVIARSKRPTCYTCITLTLTQPADDEVTLFGPLLLMSWELLSFSIQIMTIVTAVNQQKLSPKVISLDGTTRVSSAAWCVLVRPGLSDPPVKAALDCRMGAKAHVSWPP